MQLALEHAAVKQVTEDTQSDIVGLTYAGADAQVVMDLTQDNVADYHRHQQGNHLDNVVGGSLDDGLIDKVLAEPHHEQPQCNLAATYDDAGDGVEPDAPHVTAYPNNVPHFLLLIIFGG